MSDDLIDVLREDAVRYQDLMGGSIKDSLLFAADEIERLQNQLAAMADTLAELTEAVEAMHPELKES